MVGNKVFNRSFMKWFLFKHYNIVLNNENYIINTMDDNIESKIYNNNQYSKEYVLVKEKKLDVIQIIKNAKYTEKQESIDKIFNDNSIIVN